MNVEALNKDLNVPTRISQNRQLSKGWNLPLSLLWRRASLCLFSVRLKEVRMLCPCSVMFSGSNISIVSVRQTEKEGLLKMEKAVRTWDAVKPGQNTGQSGNTAFAEMRWSSARQQKKRLSKQQRTPPRRHSWRGRGGSAHCREMEPFPLAGRQRSELAGSSRDVISADTEHKARLLTLVFQF